MGLFFEVLSRDMVFFSSLILMTFCVQNLSITVLNNQPNVIGPNLAATFSM
jgi:hypothetical protein